MEPSLPEDRPPASPGWRRTGIGSSVAQRAARQVWERLGDPRSVRSMVEVSANVSTNRVYRFGLDDDTAVFVKVSNYGSYFLFREDHDRIGRLIDALAETRFGGMLAAPLQRGSSPMTYFDGSVWGAVYAEVPRCQSLPRVLSDAQITSLAGEMAALHAATEGAVVQHRIPPTSVSIKSDAIHLLDLASTKSTAGALQLQRAELDVVRRHTTEFLFALDELGYDDSLKLPVLIDWNTGNFSVQAINPDGSVDFGEYRLDDTDTRPVRLLSRWDYDWFRTEPAVLDFYFLSRVASRTGDRTRFTYGVHTLFEPRFTSFLRAYHQVRPLTEGDIRFLLEAYRFFILHYVIAVGDHFFRPDLWHTFKHDAVHTYLPALESLSIDPLLKLLA